MNRQEKSILIDLQNLYLQDEADEFNKLLSEYDWHYFQSDDRKHYLKGQYQWEKIKGMMENNITLYFIYCMHADEIYNK